MVSQKILEQYHELAHKYDRLHIFCVSTFAIDNLLILNLSMNIDSAIHGLLFGDTFYFLFVHIQKSKSRV